MAAAAARTRPSAPRPSGRAPPRPALGSPHARPRGAPPHALPPALNTALASLATPTPGLAAAMAANSAVFLLGAPLLLAGLTPAAVAHAWLLGSAVLAAFGAGGYALVCLYFLLGSAATRAGLARKQAAGVAEPRGGRRPPASVYGSGAAALVAAAGCLAAPGAAPWRLAFAASLASKLGDTVSSEIGKAYGKTAYLVTTAARVPPGTDGAVSAEGTAAGAAAAAALAGAAVAASVIPASALPIVAGAAVAANAFESWLGATLQGRPSLAWLTNDAVNVIQICVAALLAGAAGRAAGF